MKFFRRGIELKKLACFFDEIFTQLKKLEEKIQQHNSTDYNVFEQEICILAYQCRKEILDRMESYKWPLTKLITVPMISNERLTINSAYQQTVGRLCDLAEQWSIADCVNDILA